MRAIMLMTALLLCGCDKTPPLPPNLPLPRADLMAKPAPLPELPENKALAMNAFYAHAVQVRGQCVVDRTRLDHLQQYVKGLTR